MNISLGTFGRTVSHHRSGPKPATVSFLMEVTSRGTSESCLAHPSLSCPFSSAAIQQGTDYQAPRVRGNPKNQPTYIITLQTDRAHYESMKSLRNTYFPPKLNKIPAHVTLFHALPGERLESEVLPAVRKLVSSTPPYKIRATTPFRLKHGIGIGVADDIEYARDGPDARNLTKQIHEHLRNGWSEWLSEQDKQPMKVHYTIMNKVQDEADVERALEEVKQSFRQGKDTSKGHFKFSDEDLSQGENETSDYQGKEIVRDGTVDGLMLWKYEQGGYWINPTFFKFEGHDADVRNTNSDLSNGKNEKLNKDAYKNNRHEA